MENSNNETIQLKQIQLQNSYLNNMTNKISDYSFNNRLSDLLFVFVNPISGNQQGKIVLKIGSLFKSKEGSIILDYSAIQLSIKHHEPIVAFLFKLINKEELSRGRELLKYYLPFYIEKKIKLRVIIAGGDGTVLSLIEGLVKEDIDINHFSFGHMPLGTGNDLSNTLGFSNSVSINDNPSSLYEYLIKYRNADYGKVDVWSLALALDNEKGEIIEVNNAKMKIAMKDDQGNVINIYKRTFINYLSFGYDARVGFGFNKNRTSSRVCNKCLYAWEGLKKMCCRKTVPVPSFLESFTVLKDENNGSNQATFLSHNKSNENQEENNQVKFLFKPASALTQKEMEEKCIILKGNPVSIVCQNINFYMAGVQNVWAKAKDHVSIEVINTNKSKEYKQKVLNMIESNQKLDDHELEFFTYSNGFKTGLEQVKTGFADKLYHGHGPIIIKFKKMPELTQEDKYHRIYMNVDGEYFQLVNPISIRIELNYSFCNGSLPFLINRKK